MKLLFVICYFVIIVAANPPSEEERICLQVKKWSEHLAAELWNFGKLVTRRNMIVESYKSSTIEIKDGKRLAIEIATNIKTMMDNKVKAVQRIMDNAGTLAVSSTDADIDLDFQYYNAKNLTDPDDPTIETESPHTEELRSARLQEPDIDQYVKELPQRDENYSDDEDSQLDEVAKEVSTDEAAEIPQASQQETYSKQPVDKTKLNLTENPNFFNIPVNIEYSAVHVPSNVYDRSKEVIQGIKWSEGLDDIFVSNYQSDPTLSWQYFGSSTGFMRQFPAMKWEQEPTDLFDCRTRSWYIEAASSPKDIVILVDRSGSMTGVSRGIAKHVVSNILDTLGNNDYVNIFTFSNVTEPLVPCFNDTLVQANLANVRELKEHMDDFKTEHIANFSDSLTTAFRLLENYRIGSRNKSGAGCNQAIMLITDGVQYNYKELFEAYNWQDLPYKPVRVFTYLIGTEVSDVREVKWMACANQGYYVHLSTFAEVREQVLQYIPVMARPMVLWSYKPIPTWSPVYADITDPKLTNWLWRQREREEQKQNVIAYRKHLHRHTIEQDKKFAHQQSKVDHTGDLQTYTLMTSVSMPVYDRRQNATRVANLLGVAGTDVPIEYIQQLMLPHEIGVNGYAFIVTNNGYLLIHPDFRPVFEGILKPAYNRVDMIEVELPDDDLFSREYNRSLLEMRKDIVYQRPGEKVLDMKQHLDDMKRVFRGRRFYYYEAINGTPFTLVVSLPDKYGKLRVQPPSHKDDIHRQNAENNNFSKYFSGNNWVIHPDWIYCKYLNGAYKFNSSEEELKHFLVRQQREHWKWTQPTVHCDRILMNNIVSDAKNTNFFDQNITTTSEDKNGHEFIKRFGVTIAFVSTHSGLTRWQDFPQNVLPDIDNKTTLHFSKVHNTAIDEIWYRRAVEQHYVEEGSFVYSVPFEAGERNDTLITASHAIFLTNKNRKAPVAVVGYQFYRTSFFSLFKNRTNNCGEKPCIKACNVDIYCYVLDNNGYVILSYDADETGRWFGDIHSGVMSLLLKEQIYKPVVIYDYQSVCFPDEGDVNPASTILTPFKHMFQILQWTVGTLCYFFHIVTGNQDYDNLPEPTTASEQPVTIQIERIIKTKPAPCDKQRYLYELAYCKNVQNCPYNKRMVNCTRPFIVQQIANSNLMLLVFQSTCKFNEEKLPSPEPEEIIYGNNTSLACRIREDDLPRRRYAKCINRHHNESKIELCGKSSYMSIPGKISLVLMVFITNMFQN